MPSRYTVHDAEELVAWLYAMHGRARQERNEKQAKIIASIIFKVVKGWGRKL